VKHLTRREADRLISSHFEFCKKRARQYTAKTRNVDADDIESAAMVGLMKAVENFDPERVAFATYAGAVIDDHMRRARNKEWRRQKHLDDRARFEVEVNDEADSGAEITVAGIQGDHSDTVLNRMSGEESLAEWLDGISDPRHQSALLMRLRGDRVADIAARFEVVETTVYRWLQNARKIPREAIS
jgi:RNA polymerase sigma factor (sigma-70 family)